VIKHRFGQEVVCMRATSMLGTKDYDLVSFNCEHFASWCKCGAYISN